MKITNYEIAEKTGLPLATIAHFFSKESKQPFVSTVGPICRTLGISIDEVYEIYARKTEHELKIEVLMAEIEGLKSDIESARELEEALKKSAKEMENTLWRGIRIRNAVSVLLACALVLLLLCCVIYGAAL